MKSNREDASVSKCRDAYERVCKALRSAPDGLPSDVFELLPRLVAPVSEKELEYGRALRLIGAALGLSEYLLSALEMKLRPESRENPEYQVYQHLIVDLWGRHQSGAALWEELLRLGEGALGGQVERARLRALIDELNGLLARYVTASARNPGELVQFSRLAALGCDWLRQAGLAGPDPIPQLWAHT